MTLTTLPDQADTGRTVPAVCSPAIRADSATDGQAAAETSRTLRVPFGDAFHDSAHGERDARHGIQIIDRHGFTTPSGFSVNFTVGRIVSRKGKPGGESPSLSAATGQQVAHVTSPDAGYCGGVGPHDCPAASLAPFIHNGDMRDD